MKRPRTKSRVWVRQAFCLSWLDPVGANILSTRLNKRLVARNKVARAAGEPGLFLTLTYDRAPYDDPRDLYDTAAQARHVPRFIAKLRKLGVLEPGVVWICKKEFQQGGWLHYHLIVYGARYVPPEVASDAWGHGFVSIKRINRRRLDYTAKYNSKIGEYPDWLYDREVGTVRILSASHGFWAASEPPADPPAADGLSPEPQSSVSVANESQADECDIADSAPLAGMMDADGCSDFPVTFRDRIEEARGKITIHEEGGAWSTIDGIANEAYMGLAILGVRCEGRQDGGLVYHGDHEDVVLALRAFKEWRSRAATRQWDALVDFWASQPDAGGSPPRAERSEHRGGEAAAFNLIPSENCAQPTLVYDGIAPF